MVKQLCLGERPCLVKRAGVARDWWREAVEFFMAGRCACWTSVDPGMGGAVGHASFRYPNNNVVRLSVRG